MGCYREDFNFGEALLRHDLFGRMNKCIGI